VPEGLEPPSGSQHELAIDSAVVVVTEVGGGIRSFEHEGEPALFGYDVGSMCTAGRGQVLAPWPNRLADGRYRFDGVDGVAALDEPERHNAIHGLVRWLRWRAERHSRSSVTMSTLIEPQPAYPWRVELSVAYQLREQARSGGSTAVLSLEVTAANRSATPAPFGIGFHPYGATGPTGADPCDLELAAATRIVADERGLPIGTTGVAGTEYDFTAPRHIGNLQLDDCFTGLGGAWRAGLVRPDGRHVSVSAGPEFPYVMVFTADTLPDADRRRGVAIEPMTCPPNALVSGEGLVVLEPAAEGDNRATGDNRDNGTGGRNNAPAGRPWRGTVEIATGR
jgi:aldose 1-epimerase